MADEQRFMQRAIQLAKLSDASVLGNPRVGCVITKNGKIIAEGRHEKFGELHAEINALNSIRNHETLRKGDLTVYVSLEPCSHEGKTPSCAVFLAEIGIGRVLIGCTDPNPRVAGSGIEILRNRGVEVKLLEDEHARALIRPFETMMKKDRPYICLKWAESSDGYYGRRGEEVPISKPESKYLSHQWRSEFQAILVGCGTVIADNPQLTNRKYFGPDPLIIILDRHRRIPSEQEILKRENLLYFCLGKEREGINGSQVAISEKHKSEFISHCLSELKQRGVKSILVEGGRAIQHAFIKENYWDEARIIQSARKAVKLDIRAPKLKGKLMREYAFGGDHILHISNQNNC